MTANRIATRMSLQDYKRKLEFRSYRRAAGRKETAPEAGRGRVAFRDSKT